MRKGFRVVDKSVASSLVLPYRLRSGRRAAITFRNEEWAMSMFAIPTKKRTSWVDLRAAARRGRQNSAAERAATVACTTALGDRTTARARSEGNSRLGKTRRMTARERAISDAKGKGVEVSDAATTRTMITQKTSKGKGSKADKSVASGLVLLSRLRSGIKAVSTSRSEEWENSTLVIPIRKRTPWVDLRAAARRGRRNSAAARAATGSHTTAVGARTTVAAMSEGCSRLGKTRQMTAMERAISDAKVKGVEVSDAATTRTMLTQKTSKGKGSKADKSVASGLVLPSTLRVDLRAAARLARRNSAAARAATRSHTTAVGARTTVASMSEGSSRLGKTRWMTAMERAISDAKGKGVEVIDASGLVLLSRLRSGIKNSTLVIPIRKRTPWVDLRAAARRGRRNSAAARAATGSHTTAVGARMTVKTRRMTARERAISDAKGKGVEVSDAATTRTMITRKTSKGKGSKADKSVASGLVLPSTLRVDLRSAARRARAATGSHTTAVGARTTVAAMSEGGSRLGKTRRMTARERAISDAKVKGVEVRDVVTTRTKILEKISKAKGVCKADKSVVADLVLPITLRSRVREAVTLRSEKWGKSSIQIPVKKRTPRVEKEKGVEVKVVATMIAADSGEGTSKVDETRSRTFRERAAIDATAKGASKVAKDSAFRISMNILEDLQVQDID